MEIRGKKPELKFEEFFSTYHPRLETAFSYALGSIPFAAVVSGYPFAFHSFNPPSRGRTRRTPFWCNCSAARALVRSLEGQIKKLRDAGLTVLLAEQNVKSALRLSGRGYIIDNGQIRYQGSIEELRGNEEVRKKYLLI